MAEFISGASIADIDCYHKLVFQDFIRQSGRNSRLDIPVESLRYVFLPPRLQEVFIGENLDVYLTEGLDPELLSAYIGFRKQGKIDRIIDVQLKAYQTRFGSVLRVNHFLDDLRIRGKHVTSEFFGRVSEFATQLGFIGINGFNNRSNIGFFRDRLDRLTIDQLEPVLIAELVPDLYNLDPRYVTFKFLQPKSNFC